MKKSQRKQKRGKTWKCNFFQNKCHINTEMLNKWLINLRHSSNKLKSMCLLENRGFRAYFGFKKVIISAKMGVKSLKMHLLH